MAEPDPARWLLLIHQIPPKPGYLRVKIWRQLQRFGAVAIKNSVYVLPRSEQAQEDFQWVARAISEGGGDASTCEARFVDGLSDDQVEALFAAARDADYAQIAEEARRIEGEPARGEGLTRLEADVARLRRRFGEVSAIDFFGAPGREPAAGVIAALETRILASREPGARASEVRREDYRGRVWVTRKGIHVDRMASAWLVRRFIDDDARFEFVDAKGYRPEPGEVRFDMFEAEFTHDGDRCSFEVLVDRFGLDEPALCALGEIVHDIDLKDGRFGRPETAGIASLIAGIAMEHRDDDTRLARASAVFDDLHAYFRRKAGDRRRDDPHRASEGPR